MKQFKPAQIIMLPTNKADNALVKSISKLYFFKGYFTQDYLQSQNKSSFHLYITSDDEIKEGDWYVCLDDSIRQANRIWDTNYGKCPNKKIIATTDTSLTLNCNCKITCKTTKEFCNEYKILPQPSEQFIIKYIESYNKGNIITDVLVEYENYFREAITGIPPRKSKVSFPDEFRLKVNPKDNTITIKKLKDSWNREELDLILNSITNDLCCKSIKKPTNSNECVEFVDRWKSKNL